MKDHQDKPEPSLSVLREAVKMACQPQNAWRIEAGQRDVLALPRDWVLAHIEQVAFELLDFGDYWEYRRFLELASLLDLGLAQKMVTFGLSSTDSDVREAAEETQANPPPFPGNS